MGAASFGGLRANPAKLVARIEHFYAPPKESAALARGDRGGGVVEPEGEPGRAARGVPVLRELPELVALGIDYAVVACPTALHEEIGLQLADEGICALIEKPLAHSVPAAARLVAAFEGAGLVAGVGHIERYNPALQSLRGRLEAGALGKVFQVVTRRQGPF